MESNNLKPIRVTRITSTVRSVELRQMHNILKYAYAVETEVFTDIREFFSLISLPNFKTDVVAIDLEYFYSMQGVDPFQLVQTFNILLQSSNNKPKIIAAVTLNVNNKDFIKELLLCPYIDGIVPRLNISETHVQEICKHTRKTLEDVINGDLKVSKKVVEFLKTNKEAKKLNGIMLTPRQQQIYTLVAERGYSNKTIGKMLKLSESTIKLHMSSILKKYGVKNRTQLAAYSKNTNINTVVEVTS